MNQKNPPQVLRSEMRADSVPVDEHYSTEGYFYDNPILTRTGIFKYKLEDGSERRELRRPEDVFDPASLASWYNVIDETKIVSSKTVIWLCRFPKHSNIEVLTGAESGKTACLVSIQELLTA